jgi:hypothetical protein
LAKKFDVKQISFNSKGNMEYQTIQIRETEDKIGMITFHRPEKRNAGNDIQNDVICRAMYSGAGHGG